MQIGVRCHDYPRQIPEKLFAAIARDGAETVQLALKKALPEEARDIPRVDAALRASGLSLAVLGCYVELGLAEKTGREAAVAAFLQGMEQAAALGAQCIGSETTKRKTQPAVSQREALYALEKSLGEILPRAQALGVTVAVEPVFYHTMATPELTRQVLDTMRSPNLKVVFDPVNLISPEELAPARQAAMWQRAAECFGTHIAAVHIKGLSIAPTGDFAPAALEASLVPAQPVLGVLRALKYNGPVLREQIVPAEAGAELALLRRWAMP